VRPVCVKCVVITDTEKNGVWFVANDGNGRPYLAFQGDIYRCRKCGMEVMSTFGDAIDLYSNEDICEQILTGSEPLIRGG